MELKLCPYCKSERLKNYYVYIQCTECLMTGPQMNNGKFDDHCDYIDNEKAVEAWNSLPR